MPSTSSPFIANFALILLCYQVTLLAPNLGCYNVPMFSTLFQTIVNQAVNSLLLPWSMLIPCNEFYHHSDWILYALVPTCCSSGFLQGLSFNSAHTPWTIIPMPRRATSIPACSLSVSQSFLEASGQYLNSNFFSCFWECLSPSLGSLNTQYPVSLCWISEHHPGSLLFPLGSVISRMEIFEFSFWTMTAVPKFLPPAHLLGLLETTTPTRKLDLYPILEPSHCLGNGATEDFQISYFNHSGLQIP